MSGIFRSSGLRGDGGGFRGEIGGLSSEGLRVSFSARASADFSSRVAGIRGVDGITIGWTADEDFMSEFILVKVNFLRDVADMARDKRGRPPAGGGNS